MKIAEPTIILVKPQLPENIGMVARAMQNCGFNKLILVSPRKEWPNKKAIDSSAHAKIIIKNTKVYNNINLALLPFNYVIATSARIRFLRKPHENNFSKLFDTIPVNKKVAIVFGPENSGLSNEDLILCDTVFSIPLSKHNQSLNLSHSVLLMIYKWQEHFKNIKTINIKKRNLSTKEDFILLMEFLRNKLNDSGFLHPKEKRKSMFNNIQSMFLRAQLSKIEIQTLWGLIKTLINPRKR